MTIDLSPQAEKQLTNLSPGARIELEKSPTGEIVVVDYKTKDEVIAKEFSHLRGQEISLSEASRRYGTKDVPITYMNFGHWAKTGRIKILRNNGYQVMIDEADAAYCAKIYHEMFKQFGGQMAGRRIFDKDGNPYIRKFPELAERRRRQRWNNRNGN